MPNNDDHDRRFPLRRPASPTESPRARPAPTPAPPRDRWQPAGGVPNAMPEPAPALGRGLSMLQGWLGSRRAAPAGGGGVPPVDPPGPPPVSPPPLPDDEAGDAPPPRRRINWWRWTMRGLAAFIILFILTVAWLAFTAPLSKSLEPPAPPSITLLAADGTPIARRGAIIGDPVDATKLPAHVADAFIAIEDRRFASHWGIDPRGILRALVHNISSDGGSQGGSTITQQLAKNAFLTSKRTAGRKFQEVLIAFWLEAWLSKEEILSRYLSYVYFGDNVYGLRAAALHYFSCEPEELTVSQASMLAGLVQAPSRLAPTGNLAGARARQKLVVGAMVDAGMLTKTEASRVRPAVLKPYKVKQLPNGGYFADWVLPQARDRAGEIATQQTVRTTLETKAQRAAERAVKAAGLKKTQIALVAMRPDGRVVAMVGGNSYSGSAFNRATQARRQPGSTFKLFVYLAALRAGMTPDTMVEDTPLKIGDWSPANSGGRYSGTITLQQAFAKSSNVAAVRIAQRVGIPNVIKAARDLGISTPIADEASIALGTSTVSLLELTSAYASVAEGSYPVRPRGLAAEDEDQDWLGRTLSGPRDYPDRTLGDMRQLLSSVVTSGTGRGAALSIPAFGKSGTSQDGRDALFIGYSGGLVVGVWIGNDDNSPIPGLSGGGTPARVWRDFMTRTLDIPAAAAPEPVVEEEATDNGTILDDILDAIDRGEIETQVAPDGRDVPPPLPPEDRRREDAMPTPRGSFDDRGPRRSQGDDMRPDDRF